MTTTDRVAYHALAERKIVAELAHEAHRLADKLSSLGYLDEARSLRTGTITQLYSKLNTLNATIGKE